MKEVKSSLYIMLSASISNVTLFYTILHTTVNIRDLKTEQIVWTFLIILSEIIVLLR